MIRISTDKAKNLAELKISKFKKKIKVQPPGDRNLYGIYKIFKRNGRYILVLKGQGMIIYTDLTKQNKYFMRED